MDPLLAWLGNVLITVGLVVRQAAVSLRQNWGIGILSVVLAVSFWVYVTDRENPERTGRVPGAVPIEAVNVPPDQAVASLSPKAVAVSARAPQSVLEGLVGDEFRATVDLSGMTTQRATVKVQVESDESRAEVVHFSPAEITVTLEPLSSRTVPVRAREAGGLPRGFSLGAVEVDIEEAVVTGPDRLVRDVAAAEADVDLTEANATFEQRVPLLARSEGGSTVQNVDVEPDSAVVRVEVTQVEFSAAFVVLPDVSGMPAPGYNVTGIEVQPPLVIISGAAEVFRSIDRLEGIITEPVPIDDATDVVVRTVALRLPQGASAEPAGVTVRIVIERTQVSSSVGPWPANGDAGLTATGAQLALLVRSTGTIEELGLVDATQLGAPVEIGSLAVGERRALARANAPPSRMVAAASWAEERIALHWA